MCVCVCLCVCVCVCVCAILEPVSRQSLEFVLYARLGRCVCVCLWVCLYVGVGGFMCVCGGGLYVGGCGFVFMWVCVNGCLCVFQRRCSKSQKHADRNNTFTKTLVVLVKGG